MSITVKSFLFTVMLSGFSLACSAVTLNPRGEGEVLIFPYYSGRDLSATLITLNNHTDRVKVLRVRFRESRNSRAVLTLSLFLAPNDSWQAAVFASSPGGEAVLFTNDSSCLLTEADTGFNPAGDVLYIFDTSGFTGPNADGAGSRPGRTVDGFFEVIEMGEVAYDLDALPFNTPLGNAALIDAGRLGTQQPLDCERLADAWEPGGAWDLDPQTDMSEPTGGISGSASLINVLRGFQVDFRPVAINAFYDPGEGLPVSLNAAPDSVNPDLNSAATGAVGEPVLANLIDSQGRRYSLGFKRPVDAVSAVLMKRSIRGEFTLDESVLADTEWILTMPTRQYYVSTDSVTAPFTSTIGPESQPAEGDATANEPIDFQLWDNESGLLPVPPSMLRYASNVFDFVSGLSITNPSTKNPSPLPELLGNPEALELDIGMTEQLLSGFGRINFSEPRQRLVPDHASVTIQGLPVIGLVAQVVRNGSMIVMEDRPFIGPISVQALLSYGTGSRFRVTVEVNDASAGN